MNRIALKASLIIGVAFFLGFYLILPLRFFIPSYGVLALVDIVFFMASGQFYIGIGLSFLVGLVSYFLFYMLQKTNINKKYLHLAISSLSVIALLIGFFLFSSVQTLVMGKDYGKERIVGQTDTNHDGKIDKWIYLGSDDTSARVDYDTNFDGVVDTKEYFRNGQIFKKEIDINHNGKFEKTERY